MAKPILVIYLPDSENAPNEILNDIKVAVKRQTDDEYHVLLVKGDLEKTEIQVFNPDVLDEDLKEKVLKLVEDAAIQHRQTKSVSPQVISLAK